MKRNYDSVQQAAYRKSPDWLEVANLIAEQSGSEGFPVSTVEKILDKPGELIVATVDARKDVFAVAAMIASTDRPFSIRLGDDGRVTGLHIDSAKKEYSPGHFMYAGRDIAFSVDSNSYPNWVAPGVHDPSATLTADSAQPDIAVGTAEVNALFERFAQVEELKPHGDRLVGVLFQTARLALDFNVPTPTAPDVLYPEIAQAKLYYQAAQKRVQALADARNAIAVLEGTLQSLSATPRLPIHFEEPIDLPSAADLTKINKTLYNRPTDKDISDALKSYREAIAILDSMN